MSHKNTKARVTEVVAALAPRLKLNAWLSLWDGTRLPLGDNPTQELALHIADPGVLSSIMRKPGLDRIIQHYIKGNIAITGGSVLDFGRLVAIESTSGKLRGLDKKKLIKTLAPIAFQAALKPDQGRVFSGESSGEKREQADNQEFIQFHYDVGNEFYKLFLDDNMLYSCGYFTDWDNSLGQAQVDKIDMICRKLRLKNGEKFLDIGCGWGALLIHAAKNYGIQGTGVTLSKEQLALAQERVEAEGLQDKITFKLLDYAKLEGQFDKIASIGMAEHVGIKNLPSYYSKVRSLLRPGGLYLNHAITRRGKFKEKSFKSRPEQRALQKYIFPGGELDSIGNTVLMLEQVGFEVHDVEGWREHYAATCAHWHDRLFAHKNEAIAQVGIETYRIWVAYLAGCTYLSNCCKQYQKRTSRITANTR